MTKKADPLDKLNLFNDFYYTRFYKNTLIHRLFVNRVHRREPVFSYLVKHLPPQSRLLDIGCGSGNFLRFAQSHFQTTGIDISPEALKLAKKNAPQAHLQQKSIYQLKHFADQRFAAITCFDVLAHVGNLPEIMIEISRILKPHGLFAMSSPNPKSIAKKIKGSQWLNWRDPSHLWFYTLDEWAYQLKKVGLVPLATYYDGLCDSPYLPLIPKIIQDLIFRYPTQAWSLSGLPLPAFLGESFYLIANLAPGFQSGHHQTQLALMKRPNHPNS